MYKAGSEARPAALVPGNKHGLLTQAEIHLTNGPVCLYCSRLFFSLRFFVFGIYLNDALPACFLFNWLGQGCVLRCQCLTVFITRTSLGHASGLQRRGFTYPQTQLPESLVFRFCLLSNYT